MYSVFWFHDNYVWIYLSLSIKGYTCGPVETNPSCRKMEALDKSDGDHQLNIHLSESLV